MIQGEAQIGVDYFSLNLISKKADVLWTFPVSQNRFYIPNVYIFVILLIHFICRIKNVGRPPALCRFNRSFGIIFSVHVDALGRLQLKNVLRDCRPA